PHLTSPNFEMLQRPVEFAGLRPGRFCLLPRLLDRSRAGSRISRSGAGWSIAATAIAAIVLVVSIRELSTVTPVLAPAPAPQVAQEPRIDYVATLADDKSNARMLVTWDDRTSEVTVRRLSGSSDPSDKSMQLWGLPKEGHPVSFGVLPVGGTPQFKAASVNAYPMLAV
ncbi:MAG: hypothetical protein CBCREVIR_2847, partial [Candidatus Burkholderia crenata]